MKRPVVLILITLLLQPLFFAGVSLADTMGVFGPNQYERTTGSPDAFMESFIATPGSGILVIQNGEENGAGRISSAVILVNGEQVLGPNDFNQQVFQMEVPLVLTGDNVISIELKGKSGSYLTIRVEREGEPAPAVTFGATPETIGAGESCTLEWEALGAGSVTIDQGIGAVGSSGSITVSPTETTTYTITASGTGGTTTADVTVTVLSPVPTVTLSALPQTIAQGEPAVLSWTSANAGTCSIDNGIGTVDTNGSLNITPTETTTYTITASGAGGAATADITVTVVSSEPTVTLSALPRTITQAESAVLSWTSANAGTCSIDNGIGTVDTNGSLNITPTETTTYTITASGAGGAATADITVTVVSSEPTVTLSALPQTITQGESAVLSWSAANAAGCNIEPDIGAVTAEGSVTATPSATTTYTLTAEGPGGTATDAVTVTVVHPVPTVSLAAAPQSIIGGESAELSWSSTHAETLTLDQGIGTVALEGRVTVTPTETVTYTVTAGGPGGTVTASATITVIQPPTASIEASPGTIRPGESAELAWSTTFADTCWIEPEVGSVEPGGTVSVFPETTTTYTLSATGQGGTVAATVTVVVESRITLTITEPSMGGFIERRDIPVLGTFENSSGDETGIMVNGVKAWVFGNSFAANHVPLMEGDNTLTVTAVDTSGNSATSTLDLYVETSEVHITLNADMESGVSPLTATLSVHAPFSFTTPSFSYSGPGQVEFLAPTDDGRYPVKITEPGIYTFTVNAADGSGNPHVDTLALMVMAREELDTRLRAKWEGLKSALIAGYIEKALTHHHGRHHEKYDAIYRALGSDLPSLALQMKEISPVVFTEGRAKYRVHQDHNIDGQIVTVTYYVYFSKDENGLWKLEKY